MTRSTGFRDEFRDERPMSRASESQPQPSSIPLADNESDIEPDVEQLRDPAAALLAAQQLRVFLASKYVIGSFPATDVCEMAYLLHAAGVSGFTDMMIDPADRKNLRKNASRKIRAALQLDQVEDSLCRVVLPSVEADARILRQHPCRMVHEVLKEEFAKAPERILEQIAGLSSKNWSTHLVNKAGLANDDIVIPYGLFCDAAAWKGKGVGTRDSLVCYYVNIIGCSERRVLAAFRKDRMCGEATECSCRGRCTLQAFDLFLKWTCNVAAEGILPTMYYNDMPWTPELRRQQAGKPFLIHEGKRIRFALLEYRADWAQISIGLGFPATNQKHPCWFCSCSLQQMNAPKSTGWTEHTHQTYMDAVGTSLIEIVLNRLDAEQVFQALRLDKRKDGVHGRALVRDLQVHCLAARAPVQLLRWDRLELGGDCLVDALCLLSDIRPAQPGQWRLRFWRKSTTHSLAFLSPILEIKGFCLEMLTIDVLHTLDLGMTSRIIGHVMVQVLKHGKAFGNGKTMLEMRQGCVKMSRMLRPWYSQRRTRDRKYSRISRITVKMLGFHTAKSTGHLKVKGNEARHILPFANTLLLRSGKDMPHGPSLKKAVLALMEVYELMRDTGRKTDAAFSAKLQMALSRCEDACATAKIARLPKFHLAMHLPALALRAGNPDHYNCYGDESHNCAIVQVAQMCKTDDFAAKILSREALLRFMSPSKL
jgi:hypothetical protein